MAEKPVIVPVELQVADIDMTNLDQGALEHIEKQLAKTTASIGKAMGSIDGSKVGKSLETALTKVEGSMAKVVRAEEAYRQALIKAGQSSEWYQKELAALEEDQRKVVDLQRFIDNYIDKSGKYIGSREKEEVNTWAAAVRQRNELLEMIDYRKYVTEHPETFADSGTADTIEKINRAYVKLMSSVASLNKEQAKYNAVVDENKLSDKYVEQENKADRLKTKLEQLNEKSKKMAELGATDKQWESLQYDVAQVSSELDSTLRTMRQMVKEGEAFRFDAAEEDVKRLKDEIRSINATRIGIAGSGRRTGAVEARANAQMSPYTEEYKEQLENLDKLEKAVSSLTEKYKRMQALGKLSPEGLKTASYDASSLMEKIEDAKNKLMEMVRAGQAFRMGNGDASQELANITARADDAKNSLAGMQTTGDKVKFAISGFVQSLTQAHPVLGKIVQGAQKVIPVLKKIVSIGVKIGQVLGKGFALAARGAAALVKGLGRVVSRLAGAVKNMNIFHKAGNRTSGDLGKKFKHLQRNILMFGFGFRTAYYAIKRLRTVFTTAFKTLASQSEEVNAQLSSIVMTLNRLKGSLATAFQPLATVVIPLLNIVMDKLSDTMELIGKFFATLTGQNYIYKATANQYDFAASLEETGKAADEANKKLGAYDKLDVIQDDKDSGSGKGKGNLLDVTYAKADVEGAASDFATLVKQSWEKQDFTEVGQVIGDKILGFFNKVKDTILPKFTGLVNQIANAVVTGLDGLDLEGVGQKLADTLGTLLSALDAKKLGQAFIKFKTVLLDLFIGLVNGINWEELGTTIADFFKGAIGSINVEAIFETLATLLNGIGKAFLTLLNSIDWNAVLTGLLNGISAFLNTVDVSIFTEVISKLLSGLPVLIATLITQIDWTSVYEGVKTVFSGLFTSLGDAFSGSDIPIFQTIGGLIKSIGEVLQTLWPVIEEIVAAVLPIVDAILPIISALLPPVADLFKEAADLILPAVVKFIQLCLPPLQHLIDKILPILEKVMVALEPVFKVLVDTWLPFIFEILDALMPVVDGLLDAIGYILPPLLELMAPLMELLVNILRPILDLLKPVLDLLGYLLSVVGMLLEPILELLTPLLDILNVCLQPLVDIISLILSFLTPIIDIIKFVVGLISGVLTVAIKALVGVLKIVAGVLKTVGNVFHSVFEGIKSGLESAWSFIKKILNAIISGVEALTNGLIKGINFLIKGINSVGFDVPDWVPVIGGKRFGFNIPELREVNIPRLAQGAVIPPNKEFLAMLGDQKSGTNIEAPLDTIKQALAEVLAEMGGGSHDPIVLQIDGKTVAKVVWAEEEKRYKQTGRAFAY